VATVRAGFTIAFLGLCIPAAAGTVTGRVEVIEKGGRKASDLSDTVISIDGIKGKPRPQTAVMTMKGKVFTPHVVVVPVGGTVEFPNEDPLFHNVFSVSGDNRFDLDLYKRPKSGSHTFDRPGVVRVYCNIHPQMSALVVVTDSAFFTKAAADGSFTLGGVPAGKYTLRAFHERGGETVLELQVPAEGEVAGLVTLDASSFKRSQHKNKFGKDYSAGEKY
jgi:plastocyanin